MSPHKQVQIFWIFTRTANHVLNAQTINGKEKGWLGISSMKTSRVRFFADYIFAHSERERACASWSYFLIRANRATA
jgi:hypothetical protein